MTDDTTVTVTQAAVPWYTSPVQRAQVTAALSALVALSPKLGKLIGINTPADTEAWVEGVFGAITLLAPIAGTIWRARSQLQPLTLTKAGAAAHPATVAVTANIPTAAPAASSTQPSEIQK